MIDINEQILEDLNEENLSILHDKLIEYHPYDIANIFMDLSLEQQEKIKQALNPLEFADIISYLDVEDTLPIIEHLDEHDSAEILSAMESDDAVDVIQALDDKNRNKVLKYLDDDTFLDIKELTKYDETMAGSIMNNHFFSINNPMVAKDVMKKLIKESNEQELIDYLFIVDEDEHLKGIVSLKDLIVANKDENIQNIMITNFKTINAKDDIKDAVFLLKEYHLTVLAVLDDNKLVGIITIDDAIDYLDEEVTEDYDKLAGLSGKNKGEFLSIFRSRLPWLFILLLLSFLVSTILGFFEEIIAVATSLVFFQSLILDMGGNAGTQSLATSVVSISKGDLNNKKIIHKYLRKEFISGLLSGILLAICSFIITYIFMLIKKTDGKIIMISLVVALSMMLAITLSNFIGSIVPIFLEKIHIDPAVASGPFITTLNDMFGVVIYYTLAYLILIVGGFI